MSRPGPVSDLDWSPERAREFADRITGLWTELLAALPELPASPRRSGRFARIVKAKPLLQATSPGGPP